MNFFAVFMAAFSMLGALDRILGNRFGLGKEFEKGLNLFGATALSMIGMIVLSPLIAEGLEPVFRFMADKLHLEPSILPATLFANDMGGASLSQAVASAEAMGMFNGLVVSSMMGATVSFTIPVALTMVGQARHKDMLLGFLCGIVTIPVGCFFSGLMLGLSPLTLLWDLLPLVLFSALLACGLLLCPMVCVKIFKVFGRLMTILITIGLALGILEFLTGLTLVKGLGTLQEGADICLNACVVMTGAFPFLFLLSKLLKKPLALLGRKLGINETASLGFVASLATSVTTYGMMDAMDSKGTVLNSAFAISAAFTFAGHMAFTLSFDPSYLPAVIAGKLISGLCGLGLSLFIYRRTAGKA